MPALCSKDKGALVEKWAAAVVPIATDDLWVSVLVGSI